MMRSADLFRQSYCVLVGGFKEGIRCSESLDVVEGPGRGGTREPGHAPPIAAMPAPFDRASTGREFTEFTVNSLTQYIATRDDL